MKELKFALKLFRELNLSNSMVGKLLLNTLYKLLEINKSETTLFCLLAKVLKECWATLLLILLDLPVS